MKKNYTLTFILLILSVISVYGDYDKMHESVDGYLPPLYFTDSLTLKESGNDLYSKSENTLSSVSKHIEKMKLGYENKIKKESYIGFLQGYDSNLFNRLLKISDDTHAIREILKKNYSLEEIEILSALRNPSILAAQNKVKAELESFNQVMDLDENLRQYSTFTKGLENNAGPLKMNDSIQFLYPYPGVTALKGQVINSQVSIQVEKMNITRKNIITDIRNSYWELIYIDTSYEITSETIGAFNRLKDVATILYKSGKTNFQDVIKVTINTVLLKEDLITLASKRKNIEIKILELLNLPQGTYLGKPLINNSPIEISPPQDLFPVAKEYRQELKVIRLSINKTEKMIEMAESMILSPFTLNLSLYEGDAALSAGTGAEKMTFPEKTMAAMKNGNPVKPWYGIDDPWLKETKLKLSSLKQILIKEENITDSMIQEAWYVTDKSLRELDLYKSKILPLAKSARDVSTRGYESDSISFADAIDSYTYWLKVKRLIAQKQKDLGTGIAKLEKITGKSF